LLGKKEKNNLHARIGRMRTDVGTGMFLANIVFFFIILTTAQVLFKNGITNIDSAQQAALALQPLAGRYAFLLFAFGIIGTGMLAVPVLAGSGAYALAEIMNWREGLEEKFSRAKGFYLVIAFSILVGLALNFFHINPIAALYYSAFLNGIIALPLLVVIMVVGNDKKIMGKETHPDWVKFFGWISILFMTGMLIAAGVLYL
jgi:Mn2+/Fe2+ NRAMP family transporter